jgi:hypothetical protein
MDAAAFRELVAGIDGDCLCKYLRITPRTLKRWKEGTARAPHSAIIALKLKLEGDMSVLGGKDWKGFNFANGKLFPPYFRGGFTALQISAMFFERQELNWLRRERTQLMAQLEKEKATAWAMRKVKSLQGESTAPDASSQ